MHKNDPDAKLIRQCLDGHVDAFGDLVRKYQDRLYNTLYRMLGNAEDCRDLTQETFLLAYRSLDRFHGKSTFYTWLYRIAINAAISLRRRQRVTVSIDAGRGQGGFDPCQERPDSDPAAGLEHQELQQAVQAALDSIPAEYRAVLVLKEMEGQKYETIAQILGCPVGTVRSRLHRARLLMRGKLKHVIAET